MTHDLLILGDFGGRAATRRDAGEPLSRRRIRRVDRDDIDAALAAIAPQVNVAFDDTGKGITIQFAALDDFHPDRLAARVPILQQLREVRASLAAPGRMSPPRQPAPARRDDAAAVAMSGGSLIDRMLDDISSDAGGAKPSAAPADELSEFVRRAVQAHVVAETSAGQQQQIAKVDDAIAATLRVILHDPSFQALEALWRGVDLVARRVDTSESLHLTLVDVTKSEVLEALADASDQSGGLRRLLETPAANGEGSRWSMVIAAHSFGENDILALARLAPLARETGVPWIAGAEPTLAGATSFGDGSDVDDWGSEAAPGWDALRLSGEARWLGLAAPRFLVRVPYGAKTDPCEIVPFEEVEADRPAHDGFLWGNSALLCAIVLGESAANDEPWATQGTVDNLPFYVARVDGEPTAIPCAEALLSQRSVMHLLDRGLTALASERDGDAVRIARLQSISRPATPLAFWPRER